MDNKKIARKHFLEIMLLDTVLQFVRATVTGIVIVTLGGVFGHFLFGTGMAFFKVAFLILVPLLGVVAVIGTLFQYLNLSLEFRQS